MAPRWTQTSVARSFAPDGPCARAPLKGQRQLVRGLESRGHDSFLSQVAREICREAMNRVHLVGAGPFDDLHELVEITMVREIERRVGADDGRTLRVLSPTR